MEHAIPVARYWEKLPGKAVRCCLCPHRCVIAAGGFGRCRVRVNADGILTAPTYGRMAAIQVDPIEKKPLNWYKPGTLVFSIGSFGCNLACRFCQNASLSRSECDAAREYPYLAPERIVEQALHYRCESVAFTYNEPTVFFEYAVDTARAVRAAGLGTVLVSNGFISPEPRAELYPLIDAANIDIKGFDDRFYRDICGASLAPVLESCIAFKHEFGGHLEITNLLIPGENDSDSAIVALLDWSAAKLGTDTPIHFSAYFPAGGFTALPTPAATLYRARELAETRGFTRISLGNLPR